MSYAASVVAGRMVDDAITPVWYIGDAAVLGSTYPPEALVSS